MHRDKNPAKAHAGGLQSWLNDFEQQSNESYTFQSSSQMPPCGYYDPRIMSESSHTHGIRTQGIQGPLSNSSWANPASSYTSVFSDTQAVSSRSTIPPSQGPPLHRQHGPVLGPGLSNLICEFIRYDLCDVRFDIDDEQGWIEHMAQAHLGNTLPVQCRCWFCDAEYIAQSNSDADCWASYEARMHHIAGHFRTQDLRAGQMRPDYLFLDHIHRQRQIREGRFVQPLAFYDLPQIPILNSAGWRPTREDPSIRVMETSHRRRSHEQSSGQRSRQNFGQRSGQGSGHRPPRRHRDTTVQSEERANYFGNNQPELDLPLSDLSIINRISTKGSMDETGDQRSRVNRTEKMQADPIRRYEPILPDPSHDASPTKDGVKFQALPTQSTQMNDVPFIDSGYESIKHSDFSALAQRITNDEKTVRWPVNEISTEDDQKIVYSSATEAMTKLVQQSISEICKRINDRIGKYMCDSWWASVSENLPDLFKEFAIKLGTGSSNEQNRHVMYFIHKYHMFVLFKP
ncbi:hypothetical protein G7Z17_g5687 [Cylindrodendrum hubeiense]|uniref:Uncharacterized protein n=1 Tax=Cylindrodendrum hubeiense TaxID=595255 RepID=A0A9P5LBI6_9HYPO|nr:hypothetical protein G7Z17_g5687 [Cylindrodendrum hubeiense]